MAPPSVGSLFSGIGGLDLGFERAGFRVVWQCEADPFCRAVLGRHWPDVECYEDVRTLSAECAARVDVLIGGFPCQDVSDAGKRAGIVAGARSGLWREFGRLIGELRPRIVVVENVAGLFTRGIDTVLGDLAALGYDAEWTTLRASDVGAPHKRERVFIVAYRMDDADRQRQIRQRHYAGDGAAATQHGEHPRARRQDDVADAARRGQRIERGTGDARHGGYVDGGDTGLEHADAAGPGIAGEGDTRSQRDTGRDAATRASGEGLDDAAIARLEGHQPSASDEGHVHGRAAGPTRWPARPGEAQHAWEPPRVLRRAESGVGVVPDGLPAGLVRHRRRALAALGNAVVPQVAEVVAWRVKELLGAHHGTA